MMNGERAKRLRALFDRPSRVVAAPGVFDAFSARLAARSGFEAVYMTGSGVAGTLGFPDNGVVTLTEQVNVARSIARSVDVPLIADAEGGFGTVDNIRRTVREYEDAGVAGFHLEDQIAGVLKVAHVYIDGKGNADSAAAYAARKVAVDRVLLTEEEMVGNVAAAAAARRNPDTILIARTDAMPLEGIENAIARGNAYAEAGADLIFVQQPRTREEVAALVKGLRVGLMISNTLVDAAGVTTAELEQLGVKLIVCPGQALRVALKALGAAYAEYKAKGTFSGLAPAMMETAQLRELTGESALPR
jgi:2-methylisocitrate lyase-like PEP mutase family enzyme